jgi:hypothetical protein
MAQTKKMAERRKSEPLEVTEIVMEYGFHGLHLSYHKSGNISKATELINAAFLMF